MILPDNTAMESCGQGAEHSKVRESGARVWVFAGGDFSPEQMPDTGPVAGDRVVCVDRGLEHCLAAGVDPDVLIGDFDSVNTGLLNQANLAHIPRHVYPPAKAASDLELALQMLADEALSNAVAPEKVSPENTSPEFASSEVASPEVASPEKVLLGELPAEVIILGVSGGRTDHMLFNWTLPALRQWPFRLVLLDATTCCHVLQGNDECLMMADEGQIVSLLAQARTTGVTTCGLAYPLNDATLEVGSTLGLSNVVESEAPGVRISSGTLLVMINKG